MLDTKKRENWIDVLRGIGIILVLIGHNNPPFIRYIFGFHMGLFFILSGYLYRSSDIGLCVKAKELVRKYIIPYFALTLVNLIIHILHIIFVTKDINSIDTSLIVRYLLGIITVDCDNMPSCGPMWFLPALAVSLFMFELIRRIGSIIIRAGALIICCVVTVLIEGRVLPLRIHTVFIAVIFLEIGYIIRKYEVIERLMHNRASCKFVAKAVCCVVLLWLVGYLCIRFNPVDPWIDINSARFGLLPLNVLGASFTTTALMIICILSDRYISRITNLIAYLGRHTIFLLAFDEQSNSLGATLASALNISVAEIWYKAFIVRFVVLAILFASWQIVRMIVSNIGMKKGRTQI